MEPVNDEQPGNKKKQGVIAKISGYLKGNVVAICLAAALIVVAACWMIHYGMVKQKHTRHEQKLMLNYQIKMDSLSMTNKKLVSEAFAWAIRSEMIRRNVDQVDQYFLTFIRQPQVVKISYVDADSEQIMVSTDKKDEGTDADPVLLASDTTFVDATYSAMRVVTPVMGLNKRLGTLIIDYDKNEQVTR